MMRSFPILLAILLLAALLVYGGLNLVELGMTGLLGRENKHEALAIGIDSQGALLLIFAGKSARLHAGEFYAVSKQWWDRLFHHAKKILKEW